MNNHKEVSKTLRRSKPNSTSQHPDKMSGAGAVNWAAVPETYRRSKPNSTSQHPDKVSGAGAADWIVAAMDGRAEAPKDGFTAVQSAAPAPGTAQKPPPRSRRPEAAA